MRAFLLSIFYKIKKKELLKLNVPLNARVVSPKKNKQTKNKQNKFLLSTNALAAFDGGFNDIRSGRQVRMCVRV